MDTGELFSGLCALDVLRMTRDASGQYNGMICDNDSDQIEYLVKNWVFSTVFPLPTMFNPTNGQTGVSLTPALACREGIARPYTLARRDTTDQTLIGNNTDLIFNAASDADIPLNTTTGVFTLKAGVEYELTASPNLTAFTSTSGYVFFRWVFADTNLPVPGASGSMIPSKNTAGEASQPVAKATYRPLLADVDVKLRTWQSGTGTCSMAIDNSWATVQTTATRFLDYTRDTAHFQIRLKASGQVIYDSGEVSTPTTTPGTPLLPLTQYQVRVQHRDLYTQQLTAWSAWQDFTTA